MLWLCGVAVRLFHYHIDTEDLRKRKQNKHSHIADM